MRFSVLRSTVPVLFALALSCAGGTPPQASPKSAAPVSSAQLRGEDDGKVDQVAQAFLEEIVATSPEAGSYVGLHKRDGELDDRTAAGIERAHKLHLELLDRVRALHDAKLSRRARTDLELVAASLEVDDYKFQEERLHERMPPLYASPLQAIFLMMARDYAPAAERARHAVERMEGVPAVVAAAKANLKNPPKVWTDVGIDMAKGAKAFFEEQRKALYEALPSEKKRIDAAIATAQKAYADYAVFLEKEVLPRSTGSFALGRPGFDFLLKRSHFLDSNADQVLAVGEKVLKDTVAQLDATAKRIDPSAKDFSVVVQRVKGNHPTAAELVPSYKRELERARAFLVQKDAVPFPPGDHCEVIETPTFMRSTLTAAYEQSPAFDPTTKGLFLVTPVDTSLPREKQEEMLRENDHGDQVDTAVHEAYPGHHLQLSFARLHPSSVRKVMDAATFSEGWGLYSEELMHELGYYTDEERLMQLEWTFVRAARVVIDVGLHTKGMTFDEAVAFLTDRVHLERAMALSEVKRYTMTPTQPMSYVVGREEIFRLRERYKQREGAKYTLRNFHADVLSHGTIPPGLIAREMFD